MQSGFADALEGIEIRYTFRAFPSGNCGLSDPGNLAKLGLRELKNVLADMRDRRHGAYNAHSHEPLSSAYASHVFAKQCANAYPPIEMDTIRVILELLDLVPNQTELAAALGVSQPTVSRWKKGIEPKTKHLRAIRREYARRKGVSNPEASFLAGSVRIVGYVGGGGEILFEAGQGPFGSAPMPPEGDESTVAVIVRGDSMAPQLEDGWQVYYNQRREPPTEDMLGKLCVIGLRDGRVLVKRMLKGRMPGHYDLYSVNAPVAQDQPVEWAARVIWIRLT